MNLSEAKDVAGYFDFTRVESIKLSSYTKGCCSKLRQEVVMITFSGAKHTWGEYVENEKAAVTTRDSLLNAVKAAHIKG